MTNLLHKTIAVFAITLAFLGPSNAAAADGVLEGDTRLACEAILCLASGTRPGECAPSIARYFNIVKRTLTKTLSARRDFLNLCPRQQGSEATMAAHIEALVQGSGRCDAAYLNANNIQIVQKTVCNNFYNPDSCVVQEVTVVSNVKPSYCVAYANSPTTYRLGVNYVGDPMDGGHWVDDASMGQGQ